MSAPVMTAMTVKSVLWRVDPASMAAVSMIVMPLGSRRAMVARMRVVVVGAGVVAEIDMERHRRWRRHDDDLFVVPWHQLPATRTTHPPLVHPYRCICWFSVCG